ETYELSGPNQMRIRLAAQLDSDAAAQMEWTIGYLNAFVFYGGRCVNLADNAATEIVAQAPRPRNPTAIVSKSSGVRLVSPLGTVTIKIEKGPASLMVIDGRRAPDSWWTTERPSLWV